jgi:hypothetical protein
MSPGYVGLSITQSLSYGVPMIVARDEPHSPEIEAMRERFNAITVASDDAEALAGVMVEMASDRDAWLSRRADIAADCAGRYSVEVASERAAYAIVLAAPTGRGANS